MVDSMQGTQQSVTIHFSFTAGFTWCTTVSPARCTKTIFSRTICHLYYLPHHTENFASVFTGNRVFAFSHKFEFHYV